MKDKLICFYVIFIFDHVQDLFGGRITDDAFSWKLYPHKSVKRIVEQHGSLMRCYYA